MTRSRLNSLPFRFELLTVLLLGLLVRIAFVHVHPAIYGGDTLARIMNADRILLAYQLPLLQLLIYLANLVSGEPLLIRYLMSLVGALAGAAFYLFSATLLDRPTARLASLFFIFNPFLLVHSIVPYQEILMLLFLCLGLHCLLRSTSVPRWTRGELRGVEGNDTRTNHSLTTLSKGGGRRLQPSIGWASLLLGLACLTRYEAWVIAATAGLYYVGTLKDGSPRNTIRLLMRTIALFGWAPLLWILLHRGVSPQGTYVLEGLASWARLWRIPYVAAMALVHAGPVVGLLAVFGLLTFWKSSLWHRREIQMVLGAAALLMLSLVFSAHGVEPDPQRYVTDREAHWFVLFPLWAAAVGLMEIQQRLILRGDASHSKTSIISQSLGVTVSCFILILAVAWGASQTDRYIKRLLTDQNLHLDYAVAQHLEKGLPQGSKALIFAKPLPSEATQDYFDKVSRQGGTAALEVARRQLAELNSGPLDYSRIVVNTHLRKDQLIDASKLRVDVPDAASFLSQNHVGLAVIFSDYPTQAAETRHLLDYLNQRGKPQATLKDGALQVSIVEVRF
jgi:hypothetical protein